MGIREEKIAEKHKRIVESASKHFALHGFEGTKMAQVAKDAEVAVGTIYLRYPNKSSLLTGVLDHYEDVFVDAMTNEKVTSIQWPERFSAIFASIMLAANEIDHIGPIMALSSHSHVYGHVRGAKIQSHITKAIEEGQLSGTFHQHIDARIAASMAYNMVDGAMMHMMMNPDVSPDSVIYHLSEACTKWMISN